jgi:SAM-dependent methyltransferase
LTDKPKTSSVNAKLWGARARDWADFQEGQMKPAYEAMLSRFVTAGTRYLDVGCGSGMATQMAAARGAKVSGTDAADPMLAIARERTPDGDFRNADLEELPFADATFDFVTGFNAFQYAGNPVRALAEAGRVTKPDGHIVVMTWGPPDTMQAASLLAALRPLLPAPPPGAPGPFALSDETALRALATSAGLTPGDIVDVECAFQYADLATGQRALGSAGVAVRAVENSSDAAVDEAHAKALAPFRQADGSYRIQASFRCLIARPG